MSVNRRMSFSKATGSSNVKSAAPAEPPRDSHVDRIVNEIRENIKKGVANYTIDLGLISPLLDLLRHPGSVDDRKLLLEYVLTALASHPPSSTRAAFERETVKLLYNDLSHPPATYIGPDHSFRTADGSGNNLSDPNMGKADTPYARSVQQTHPLPENQLPDPDLIFETLLKRDKFVPHPAGLSSMMFSFAALVIHTVFRTSHEKPWLNETSSYVDLAPLYGSNKEALDKIRAFDGRGQLKKDTFAEDRLLLLPPAVCCLLVLFNRNHNYIAKKLLEINERGKWRQDPETAYDMSNSDDRRLRAEQEEEIFNIARLCNCGWFGSAIFSDYFSSILGLVRTGSNWSLNPFGEMRNLDHTLFERGRGNVCSVEFNCLYRWHATTSEPDEQWVGDMLSHMFSKPADQIDAQELKDGLKKYQASEDKDPSHWVFGQMERGPDRSFKNADLAKWIKNATQHPAGAFKARGTPSVMQLHETMGIRANRLWGVCSMNDFRRFLGLKPYDSFLEWNSDKDVAETAERLYGNIENLELYVGLQAEEPKPVVPGAGLCPGYTISRAILSDAIALTRGDRFFTADYTPYNMTAWGFADCQRDANGPGNGSMLGRLIMRTLPDEFTANSSWAWFPLQTPDSMKDFLGKLGSATQYDFKRPDDQTSTAVLKEYRDVERVLKSKDFAMPYGKKATKIIDGPGFFIASTDAGRAEIDQRDILRALVPTPEAKNKLTQFFYSKTREIIEKKSFALTGVGRRNVDIVQDVLKYIPVHWVLTEVAGIPLQTKDTQGIFSEAEIYDKLSDIYMYLFLDVDKSKEMRLEQRVKEHVSDLKQLIEDSVRGGPLSRLSISGIINTLSSVFGKQKKHRNALAEELLQNGSSEAQVVNNILALMVGATVELSQSLINAVNLYFKHGDVVEASLKTATAASETVKSFVYEAGRVDPAFRGVYREALSDQQIDDISIKKGQRVFLDLAAASLNEDTFPSPETFNLSRPAERYLAGDGAARALGNDLSCEIMASVIRAILELNGVKPAKSTSGKLKRYRTIDENSLRYEYLGKDQLPTPWPNGSYILQYDAAPVLAPGPVVMNGTAAGVAK